MCVKKNKLTEILYWEMAISYMYFPSTFFFIYIYIYRKSRVPFSVINTSIILHGTVNEIWQHKTRTLCKMKL